MTSDDDDDDDDDVAVHKYIPQDNILKTVAVRERRRNNGAIVLCSCRAFVFITIFTQ